MSAPTTERVEPRDFSDSDWQRLHERALFEIAYRNDALRRPPTVFAQLDSRWSNEFTNRRD